MGSPAIYGLKKNGELKVTYAHYGRYFIDEYIEEDDKLNYDGVLLYLAVFIRKTPDEILDVLFDTIVLEDDEDSFPNMTDEENEIDFDLTDNQIIAEELFEDQPNMVCPFPDGTMHILSYEDELKVDTLGDYFYYVLDLDRKVIHAEYENIGFDLPFRLLRNGDEQYAINCLKMIRNAHSLLSGRGDFEKNAYEHRWKTFNSGKLTQKGQLTIPVEVREAWKLKEGDTLEFVMDEKKVVAVKPKLKRSVKQIVGSLAVEMDKGE